MLTPLLQPEELHYVFGCIAQLFGKSLSEAFSRLDPLVRNASPFHMCVFDACRLELLQCI